MSTEQFIRESAARVAAGMSLRDALLTPRQQPKPGRRHPWNRSRQEHA
ncbi:hypothetical protein MNU23_31015 [Pseudomonas aeruginosa]|nr:hypothetical protein [Pseudomonas aeruginosa]MCT2416111.1 hypothetical protein [Pseudomonas aeruginosa]